jgi:hypothetical protein
MSYHPEPISIVKACQTLPDEPESLEPARDTLLELGGDPSHPTFKRLQSAVTELREATDEMTLLMEDLHDQLGGMSYD